MVARIALPPDIAETVLTLVSGGDYPNVDAVIREAFDLLEQRRESARLWDSILAADRSIEEGHGIPWNAVTKATIEENAKRKLAMGVLPNPDVIP